MYILRVFNVFGRGMAIENTIRAMYITKCTKKITQLYIT